ncbi:MAG: hypothetical protein HYR94_12735 [Chloroflexi bacterium]|nr:hypothetical protein [Chloroflexota bacterium]
MFPILDDALTVPVLGLPTPVILNEQLPLHGLLAGATTLPLLLETLTVVLLETVTLTVTTVPLLFAAAVMLLLGPPIPTLWRLATMLLKTLPTVGPSTSKMAITMKDKGKHLGRKSV